MERYIYDERSGLQYELTGDYYLPCLEAPEAPQIGAWGRRRRTYLREHNKALYTAILLSDELDAHLEAIDRDAERMFDLLVAQLAEQDGINEVLKAQDQMAWVEAMNNIRNAAEAIILDDLIYR